MYGQARPWNVTHKLHKTGEDDTDRVRTARNAYAAAILFAVIAVHILVWLTDLYGPVNATNRTAVYAAGAGTILALTGARRIMSHASTFAHELSHCVAAIAVGASPRSITYQTDSTGLAVLAFPERVGRYRRAIVFLSGYLGPVIAASTILCGLATGYTKEGLVVLSLACGGALLLLVRNFWGACVTGLLAAAAWLGAVHLPTRSTEIATGLLVGALATLGVRDAWGQLRLKEPGACDAAEAARELHGIPWKLVAGFQMTTVAFGAGVVAYMLLKTYGMVP